MADGLLLLPQSSRARTCRNWPVAGPVAKQPQNVKDSLSSIAIRPAAWIPHPSVSTNNSKAQQVKMSSLCTQLRVCVMMQLPVTTNERRRHSKVQRSQERRRRSHCQTKLAIFGERFLAWRPHSNEERAPGPSLGLCVIWRIFKISILDALHKLRSSLSCEIQHFANSGGFCE